MQSTENKRYQELAQIFSQTSLFYNYSKLHYTTNMYYFCLFCVNKNTDSGLDART